MPGQGRLGDKAQVPIDVHGCPACPHPAIGPAITGSADVLVNKRPALRVDDLGVHAACCGTNMWTATKGSMVVFINGRAAHRMGDQNRHCGGMGTLIEGSPNVIVGETGGGGGAASGGGGGGGGGAGGGGGGAAGGGGGGAAGGDPPPSTPPDRPPDDPPETPPDRPPADETSFVELELVDAAGTPVAGERYRVTAADGQVFEGTLDAGGSARIEPIPAGDCQIAFPDRAAGEYLPEGAA